MSDAFGRPETQQRRRPSRAGYGVGAGIIALGVVAAVVWGVLSVIAFSHAVDGLARVDVPGSRVVTLSEGRKSIYYEGLGGEDAQVPPLGYEIRPLDGAALRIGDHSGEVTYSASGHAGRSIASVVVPRDGRYRVTTTATANGGQLAIGRGLGHRIVSGLLGAFGIVIVGGLLGTAVIVTTSVRRSRT